MLELVARVRGPEVNGLLEHRSPAGKPGGNKDHAA
jgi:hypothetical protein